jgi:hypothetical protein
MIPRGMVSARWQLHPLKENREQHNQKLRRGKKHPMVGPERGTAPPSDKREEESGEQECQKELRRRETTAAAIASRIR